MCVHLYQPPFLPLLKPPPGTTVVLLRLLLTYVVRVCVCPIRLTFFFHALFIHPTSLHSSRETSQAERTFAEIDTDGDGVLTQDELLIYLLETQGFEPEEVSAVFRQLDTDGDGVVTKAEFVAGHAAWRDAGLASQSWGAHGEVVPSQAF